MGGFFSLRGGFAAGFGSSGAAVVQPPSRGTLEVWASGRSLDGHGNQTVVDNTDITTIPNLGRRGGSIVLGDTGKPKFKIQVNQGIRFGSIKIAGGDRLIFPAGVTLGPNSTICVAVKRTASGANCTWIDGVANGARMSVGENGVGGLILFAGLGGVTAGSGTTTNKYNVVVARFNGASSSVAVNGPLFYDQSPLVTADAGSQQALGITIGSAYDGSAPAIGEILEVLVWSGPVTSQAIHDYIDRAYSVGWPKTAPSHFDFVLHQTPLLTIATNDKVAIPGDSITLGTANQGSVPWFNPFKAFVQAGVSGTVWVNAGVGGNTAAQIRARLATDVIGLSPQPKVVIFQDGANDAFQRVDIADYMTTLQGAVDDLRAGISGVKLALVGTMCRGEFYPDPSNIQWGAYSLAMNKVAFDNGIPFIDTRTPQQAYERSFNVPPPGTAIAALCNDGEHLSTAGINLWSAQSQAQTVLAP